MAKKQMGILSCVVLVWAVCPSRAADLGTAFTYQGTLVKNGVPVTSEAPHCEIVFKLWDDPDIGNPVGDTPQILPGVEIIAGLFTVEVDFGPGAFNGNARWLAVHITCPGDIGETQLDPRQEFKPAPYAQALPGLYTQQNGVSPNIIGGYGGNAVTGGVFGATIGGGGADGIPNSVTGNHGTVGGGVQNTAGGPWSTVGGGEFNHASGDTSTVSGGGSNMAAGLYATVPGGALNSATGTASFAAGSRAQAAHYGAFVWNNTGATLTSTAENQFLIGAAGGVGIGTNAPSSLLHIDQNSDTIARVIIDSGSSSPQYSAIEYQDRSAAVWGTGKDNANDYFVDQVGVARRLTIDSGTGNVGIGTNNPTEQLHVAGNTKVDGWLGIANSDGSYALSASSVPSPFALPALAASFVGYSSTETVMSLFNQDGEDQKEYRLIVTGTNGSAGDDKLIIRDQTASADRLTIDSTGRVGLGTTTPQNRLDVAGNAVIGGVYAGSIQAPGGSLLVEGSVGIGTTTPSQKLDVAGTVKMSGFVLSGTAVGGKVLTADASGVGTWQNAATSSQWTTSGSDIYYNGGNVGIGTIAPDFDLHVVASGDSGIKIQKSAGGDYPQLRWTDAGNTLRAAISVDMTDPATPDMNLYVNGADRVRITDQGNVGIGTATPTAKLDVAGWTRTEVLEITGGSDIAEPFDVEGSDAPLPGMVLSIDAEHVGRLRVSSTAYDPAVAGIVSGAGGVNPGVTLTQKGSTADGKYPVALTGRVWCLCDGQAGGPIRPGDLLTTSETPGHAMKATDSARSDGAILGKAMSALDDGTGLVLVLVSLQ